VPAIGVDSGLIGLGLNPDHTLEVPKDFGVAGWYVYRPVPGQPGPSVIAGHVDSRVGPAVFYRLKELGPGSTIEVDRNDRSTAVFSVAGVEEHPKDQFPTDRVYGPTAGAELRVITCGGAFDWSTHHYVDNVIVFATLSQIVHH
jgi:sortase (surface protein transpeptidase)